MAEAAGRISAEVAEWLTCKPLKIAQRPAFPSPLWSSTSSSMLVSIRNLGVGVGVGVGVGGWGLGVGGQGQGQDVGGDEACNGESSYLASARACRRLIRVSTKTRFRILAPS